MPCSHIGGVEENLHSSLTLTPDGVSGWLYAQATLLLRKELLLTLNKSLKKSPSYLCLINTAA